MCRPCWRLVPKPLQDEVWKHYKAGQEINGQPSRDYVAAARAAIRALEHIQPRLSL